MDQNKISIYCKLLNSEYSHVLPHAAGVMYDLKMVIPFTVCYAVLGYSLKTGISWFYVYYVVFGYFLTMGIS